MRPSLLPNYRAHPLLDPRYFERGGASARALRISFERMSESDEQYQRLINRFLNPLNRSRSLAENRETVRRYLVDVNGYLHEILGLLDPGVRKSLSPDPEVLVHNDIRELLGLIFSDASAQVRFEAQRKLYLAKLFFDIDHEPGVQMGPLHLAHFEKILDQKLWSRSQRAKPVELFFEIAPDGVSMDINTKPTHPGQEKWAFHLIRMPREGKRPIHIYHYACRFKREVASFQYQRGESEYHVQEQPIWEQLHERRSGSILSKMIRKGEVHPSRIQDLIGAMFIVKDRREVEELQEILFDIFGGPLRWKDLVNTIESAEDRELLNAQSGLGYSVLKSDVDVLFAPPGESRKAYMFAVEVQIYTVEGFLRTIHSKHYANHQRLKLRQFLLGLLPSLFPVGIYGEDAIGKCLDSLKPLEELSSLRP